MKYGHAKAWRLGRRAVLAGLCSLAAGLRHAPARAAARLGDDGLYYMDWYVASLLELADDLADAATRGKRLAVLWGLRGCPACRRMHEVHLADPTIAGYIRDHFDIVHLDIVGSREVTDFDGTRLPEKELARRYGVRATPTIQFFPESIEAIAGRPPAGREVARLATLPEPAVFLAMFRYVHAKGYTTEPFEAWLKRQA
ncbi:MAG: thioredoxin [Alphaproteobacteria bacterium]|nr:thioredoxin [Alphaproteobacteria bacterium]